MTTVLDNTTNPYALTIYLTSKSGLILFKEATKGLSDDEKIIFKIASAASFNQEIVRAAAKYCWGLVCSAINDNAGNSVHLLENYKDLNSTNVKDHADATWNATNNVISPATGGSPTAAQEQIRIFSSMMANWI